MATSISCMKNVEKNILESLLCIDYLLKNTDEMNCCNTSAIIRYIDEKYNYESRRQDISMILRILEKHSDETRRLGFVVGSKQTGRDPKRRKFYISERLLTMTDINAIHIALSNFSTPLISDSRIKEIINGLKLVFPTTLDKKTYKLNESVLIDSTGKTNNDKIREIINQAFVNKYLVTYKTKDSLEEHSGRRIMQIYYQGNGDYDIELYNDSTNANKIVKLSDITYFKINYSEHIDFEPETQLLGNLDLDASLGKYGTNLNSFLTIDKVNNYLARPIKDTQMTYISFEFHNLDIIKSFNKEFEINLLDYLINKDCENMPEDKRKIYDTVKQTYARVYVSRQQFVQWASRPENILDLYNIYPEDINLDIKTRIDKINRLAQQKYSFCDNTFFKGFEILFKRDKQIAIKKILSSDEIITIPSKIIGYPVTEICDNASKDNKYIKRLILPPYIKSIGNFAFGNCENLNDIVFNGSLQVIGSHAFYGCTSLKSIRIDSNIKNIGDHAFAKCSSLTKAIILSNEPIFVCINDSAFASCDNLENADFAFVSFIGNELFDNCSKLQTLCLRCSTNVNISKSFLANPITRVYVQYNDFIPENDPFKNTICADTYICEETTHWYDGD